MAPRNTPLSKMTTQRSTSKRAVSKRRPVTTRQQRRPTTKSRKTPPNLKGERHPAVQLTEQQVRDLRAGKYDNITLRALAKKWGVAPTTLTLAKTGRTWTHLPGAREPLKPGYSLARPLRPMLRVEEFFGKNGVFAALMADPRPTRKKA